jgi:hypothetical protein
VAVLQATGGNAGAAAAAAGSAAATGAITGAKAVNLSVGASGGSGAGGTATATATAAGTTAVTARATAAGGLGTGSAGTATAQATGNTGTVSAITSAQIAGQGTTGVLIDSVSAVAGSILAGNGTALDTGRDTALARFGAAIPGFDSVDQGVADITGAPTSANIASVLAANSTIATAFAVSPSYFGLGELGGRYSTAGKGSETTVSTTGLVVDLGQLAVKQDLLIGFYGGTLVGTGVTGVTLTITANGTTLLNQSFTSGAAAKTWFTNNAVDLGSLTASLYAGGVANLSISLAVTANAAGSGFYGAFVIGDPPKNAALAPVAMPVADNSANAFAGWAHLLGATRLGSHDSVHPGIVANEGGLRELVFPAGARHL